MARGLLSLCLPAHGATRDASLGVFSQGLRGLRSIVMLYKTCEKRVRREKSPLRWKAPSVSPLTAARFIKASRKKKMSGANAWRMESFILVDIQKSHLQFAKDL